MASIEIINLLDSDDDDDFFEEGKDDEDDDDEEEIFFERARNKRKLAKNENIIAVEGKIEDDNEDDDDDDVDLRPGSKDDDNEENKTDYYDEELPKNASSAAVASRESPKKKRAGEKVRPIMTTTTTTAPSNGKGNSVAMNKPNDYRGKMADDNDAAVSAPADEDELDKAIRLSLEEAELSKRIGAHDDVNEAIRLSLIEKAYSESEAPPCRMLSRSEFKAEVDKFIHEQGGYEAIESGMIVKHGNANDMNKSCVADGGGQNQTSAQYGRYSIDGMFRVFDVLEGKEGKEIKPGLGINSRLEGLPGAKIAAFVDIGHGIGIQVLQAGWSHGVPARGVEIMKGRHLVAEALLQGVLESLRSDPPDSTAVELRNVDFSHAIVPNAEGCRDEGLREYLLFADKSIEVQRGLVIFINNAEEVFGPRSNQNAKGEDLDAFLARLFANMKVGGRMVTLTDISCYLTQSTEWFRRDVFESDTGAVSWGNQNKSVNVYVLTKLEDKWSCQYKDCCHKKCYKRPAEYSVVDDNGEPIEVCVFCNERARPCPRLRKPAAAAEQPTAAANARREKNSQKRKSEDE